MGGFTTSSLTTGINTVKAQDNTGNLTSVATPTVVAVGTASVTVVTGAPTAATSSGDDDTGLIVGVVLGSVIGFAVLVAIVVLLVMKFGGGGGEAAGGTAMEMTSGAQTGPKPSETFVQQAT